MVRNNSYIISFSLLWLAAVLASPIQAQVVEAGEDIAVSSGVPVRLEATFNGYIGVSVTVLDDKFVGPFPIGFEFEFFGETFTEFYIGPDGMVSFDSRMLGFSSFDFYPIPNSQFPKTIMGPSTDLFDRLGQHSGFIYYALAGSAPNRRMIIAWCNAPMYECFEKEITFQIVLHEGTGLIENHLFKINSCSSWKENIQGLNWDENKGISIPGRNMAFWEADEETWVYTADGNGSYNAALVDYSPEPITLSSAINWAWYQGEYPGGDYLGGGSELSFEPKRSGKHTAVVSLCGGQTYTDELIITIIPVPNAFRPDSRIEENRTFRMLKSPEAVLENYELLIFNHWGEQIFRSTNIDEGWDGRFKGEPCPAGNYIWLIQWDKEEEKISARGSVLLLR